MTDQPLDEYVVLEAPADGVPAVVRTPEGLAEATAALVAGSGPVAIDTERAQGFRYSARAYLIQLRREGAGTILLDPIPFASGDRPADLSALADALADAEWVLHAATQDLPCLAEVRLLPRRLFDTELAARLLGMPRVALGTLLEEAFGLTLRKEHSAADWSRRPLPGLAVNITPATSAGTSRCTTTAMRGAAPVWCCARYATARSPQSEAQQRLIDASSASVPVTLR